ncbi:hypothetical protein HMPREF9011_02009 [Bacteroides sp. 3_1_40A]|nr:hypothetical protein HMPREF9011_02009 [Bacteroides sp. 3_1_40A]
MKIIVWNSQDKCVADYHKLIRGCDVLCLLDCGQWTVPVYALQIQNGLFHWKDEHEGLSYDIFYCLEKVAFICRDGLYSGESVLYSIHSNIGSLVGIRLQDDFWLFANHESNRSNACHIGEFYLREISDRFRKAAFGLSGNFWLLSFKISYLCLPLFYETRTTPSCHPSGCAYRQL